MYKRYRVIETWKDEEGSVITSRVAQDLSGIYELQAFTKYHRPWEPYPDNSDTALWFTHVDLVGIDILPPAWVAEENPYEREFTLYEEGPNSVPWTQEELDLILGP